MCRKSFSAGFLLLVISSLCLLSEAFPIPFSRRTYGFRSTAIQMATGGDSTSSGGQSGAAGAMELTSALARLDKQWEIQQRFKKRARWRKIHLTEPLDGTPDPFEAGKTGEDFVYLLEPPNNSVPSSLIVFVGGAGLGNYPQIAYNELLTRISNSLNAAVLTAPYPIGLDHFGLAKKVGDLSRRGIIQCEDDSTLLYPSNLPTYCIGHSLGCKLLSIYMAATNQEFEGIGFISFNNFGFSETIGMAKEFADLIQKKNGDGTEEGGAGRNQSGVPTGLLDQVFSFAEQAIDMIGVEFTPTPAETERLISLKYDEDRIQKTRLFTFDDDQLDDTEAFANSCQGRGPEVSGLPGTHLTPVFFKVGLDEVPEEAREIAQGALGGIESASFGNEEELTGIVDEICGWILGKGPSRPPKFRAQITGSSSASDN